MISTTKSAIGPSETDAEFSARLTDVVCKSFSVPSLALGTKLGIYDVLERLNKPVTFSILAQEAKLKPRYVQEWCRGMVMAEYMSYDADHDTFYITPSRLKIVKQISIMAQFSVDTHNTRHALEEAMKEDGPRGFVPWDHGDFSTRMQMARDSWVDSENCLEMFLDVVPGLKTRLESGIKVCEVGSNYGSVLLKMAEMFPKSVFTGLDICEEVCISAQEKADRRGVKNITFKAQDLFAFPPSLLNQFDYTLVYDVVHDTGDPPRAVQCIHDIVAPGGYLSLIDIGIHSDLKDNIGNSSLNWIYPVSMAYCLGNSMHDGGDAGAGYGMEKVCEDVKSAGFQVVSMQPLPYVPILNHTVCLKPTIAHS